MTLTSNWAAKVYRSVLVELRCFTLDQLHPCLSICVASTLEVVAALWGEKAEEMLPAPFRVFEVSDSIQVVKPDLFQQTLFGG